MARRWLEFLWIAGLVHVLGCGGVDHRAQMRTLVARGAYAEAVAKTRREPALEKELAEVLLEHAARSADPERRRRTFAELSLTGSRARPVLSRLTDASEPLTRAHAWAALAQLGDRSARESLRDYADSPDPELSALGYAGLDPDSAEDRARLLAALTLPNRARRATAVRVLGTTPPAPDVRLALESAVQHDPEPTVRAAAVSALARQGIDAAGAIERALSDESQLVRVAAVQALATVTLQPCAADECDLTRVRALLRRDLGDAPSPETLAAATALLRASPREEEEVDRARDVFTRALTSGDSSLRARAAVLCRGLPAGGCDAAILRERVRIEPSPEVKLLVALAIGPTEPLGRAALTTLAHEHRTSISIEAAAELAASGDASAQKTLAKALQHPEPRIRVSALRAVARLSAGGALEDEPDATLGARVAEHLADRDERVRTAAAAAVLGAG